MGGHSESKSARLFSYNIYVYKKPGMDEASHHEHIRTVNTPIIKPLLEKYGAVSYTVVRSIGGCGLRRQIQDACSSSFFGANKSTCKTHNDAAAKRDYDRLFPEAPEDMLVSWVGVFLKSTHRKLLQSRPPILS